MGREHELGDLGRRRRAALGVPDEHGEIAVAQPGDPALRRPPGEEHRDLAARGERDHDREHPERAPQPRRPPTQQQHRPPPPQTRATVDSPSARGA
ncbi:hypothetical protein, partial [uncultured Microbacterium sp.]|uniref:hypothetical protein n=1 Tax=uncultured Microbacterium sp. TaxID=191216 RepID=UPI00344589FC